MVDTGTHASGSTNRPRWPWSLCAPSTRNSLPHKGSRHSRPRGEHGLAPERLFVFPNTHVLGAGAGASVIDATGQGRSAVIFSPGGMGRPGVDFMIDGFTITGGSGLVTSSTQDTVSGGGVYVFGDA